MRRAIFLTITVWLACSTVAAQFPGSLTAANPVQQSQLSDDNAAPIQAASRNLKIPAGTPLEIESTYTVNSRDLRAGDFLSFRVLVPIKIDGITVIQANSLATGRVFRSKRGGHWGKAGKLVWTMQDVVAVDLTRVPITFHQELKGQKEIEGTSHGGQVAATAIVFGTLLFPASPLALMAGFKRGDDAVLPEGHRFVVYIEKETIVSTHLTEELKQTP